MILKNDDIDAVVDPALGISIAACQPNLCKQVIEQLFEVKRVYNGLSYDEYSLRPYNPCYIIGLSKKDKASLIYILKQYFAGTWGCKFDIKNNGYITILQHKD